MLFRFLKREKKPLPPQPMAGRLLNIAAILIFAGVIIYQMKYSNRPEPVSAITAEKPLDVLGSYYIQAARQSALSFFHRLGGKEPPVWTEITPGTGNLATCGMAVEADIALLETDGKTTIKGLTGLLPTHRAWRLGDPQQPIDHALQPLLLNLRAGGVREVRMPLSLIHAILTPQKATEPRKAPDRTVLLRASLHKAAPAPTSAQPLILLESTLGDPEHAAACGQPVTLALRIWRTDGTEVSTLEAEPVAQDIPLLPGDKAHLLTGILGHGSLPYGLERAVEGMGVGAVRVALIPPELQSTLQAGKDSPPKPIFPTPAQTMIVQVTLSAVAEAEPAPQPANTPPPLQKSEPLIKPAQTAAPLPSAPTESTTP